MSSPIKSEVKIAAAQDIGVRIDDLLEQAKSEVAQTNGAQMALNEGAKAVAKLMAAVDGEIDSGLLDLPTAKVAKQYVGRAVAMLENLSRHMGNLTLAANGKVDAYSKAVASVKTYQDAEQVRLQGALAQVAAAGAEVGTAAAPRPGKTIKQLRLDEATTSKTNTPDKPKKTQKTPKTRKRA